MSVASSRQSFLLNVLTSSDLTPSYKPLSGQDDLLQAPVARYPVFFKVAKLAIVALAAGVLTLGSVGGAFAAKTGGRVVRQAFRPSAPRSSGPWNNNSRTNIFIKPPIAPPLVGEYGYGYSVPFYGGWGWSPFSFFAPGPGVAVNIGAGFDTLALFLLLSAVAAVVRRFVRFRDEEDGLLIL